MLASVRINSEDHPGMALIAKVREPIYEKWLELRSQEGGDDLAAFVFEEGEHGVGLVMGPRASVIQNLIEGGVDFSKFPDIHKPASVNNPFPAMGLWVIVGLPKDTENKKQVAITRFVEPLLGRISGGVRIGQA